MLRPLILGAAGFAAAYLPVLLGFPDLPPAAALVPMVCGTAWAWACWRGRRDAPRTRLRLALASLLTLGVGLHVLWFSVLAAYTAPPGAPVAGASAPHIEAVRARDGARFRLVEQKGTAFLLVFFRGPW